MVWDIGKYWIALIKLTTAPHVSSTFHVFILKYTSVGVVGMCSVKFHPHRKLVDRYVKYVMAQCNYTGILILSGFVVHDFEHHISFSIRSVVYRCP